MCVRFGHTPSTYGRAARAHVHGNVLETVGGAEEEQGESVCARVSYNVKYGLRNDHGRAGGIGLLDRR